MRSGLDARRRPPTSCQPGSLPVSCRRSAYRPTEYIIIRVRLTDERRCQTRPAGCQVDPEVRSYCSTSTTSFQPSRARWYAMLAPPTPPPITTAWASLLMDDPPSRSALSAGRYRALAAGEPLVA